MWSGTPRRIAVLAVVVVLAILAIALAVDHDRDSKEVQMPELEGKRVIMIVASKGFNPVELRTPQKLLEQGGADVLVASSRLEGLASERWPLWSPTKLRINADMLIEDINVLDYDAFVFVGGGEEEYVDNPVAHRIAQEAVAAGKVVAGICRGPLILANAGVLRGKKATVWHPFGLIREYLRAIQEKGAIAVEEDVVVDGRLVTANRPTHAATFTKAIAELLAEE